MSIRAFLAVDLNRAVRETLTEFQNQVASILPVKWVSPKSMHLTIKFLGDIEHEQITVLQNVLRDVTKGSEQFSLTIKGLGGFPSLQKPRVLWAGVAGDVDHLEVLVSCVESALNPLGYGQEDRPYRPHLTLSRIKSHARQIGHIFETSEVLKKEWMFGSVIINRLCLFQSQLTPNGATYSRLWELPLGMPRE